MADRRTTCLRCRTYDRENSRCRIGKTNPRKKHESLTVAELLGVQSLCMHNPHREPLILRMRYSDRRYLWDATPNRFTVPIEIEIIEENEEINHA